MVIGKNSANAHSELSQTYFAQLPPDCPLEVFLDLLLAKLLLAVLLVPIKSDGNCERIGLAASLLEFCEEGVKKGVYSCLGLGLSLHLHINI